MGDHLHRGIKRARNRLGFILAGLTIVAIGCASPASPGPAGSGQAGQPQSVAPKRLVAAVASTPYALNASLGAYLGSAPGMEALGALVDSGFVIVDHQGNLQPLLAERVPTAENGDWKIFPTGKMDVKWVIREGAKWHNGIPVTSDDIAFTYQLATDRDLSIFAQSQYRIIESLETPDARTVIAHWTRPFLYANLAFGYGNDNSNLPLPRHILETLYHGDRDTFLNLPYWTSEFVGTGPYKLKEWEAGIGVSFLANDAFVRGRPKIDEIEVRYITAFNTLAANLLAGTVQVNFGLQAGIGGEVVVPPPQLDADIEYASTYPGLQLVRRGNFRWDLKRPLSSAEAPLPENKFNGGNRGRYMNAELDILLDRYETAVAYPEHVQLLREIVHHVSDQLVWMGLFYATDATIYDAQLQGVHGKWERTTQVWNIWEWDYK